MSFLNKSKKADLICLAEDLGESPDETMSKVILKELILASKHYNEEEAKEYLEVIVAGRLEQEQKLENENKLKQEREKEKFALEKLRLEVELSRINQNLVQNSDQVVRAKSLDEIVRMVRLLTVKVPSKSDGWDYFFSSLEKAFVNENVSDEFKPKVLLCLLGDKVPNLLVNIEESELKNYESLKKIVLQEYEPSPKLCLENFRKAKRNNDETFSQFASRLTSMWVYYCKSRGASDFETVNQLIVADKMFQTLDSETATHIGVLQGESWFKPKEMGKRCDVFYASKGKSYDGSVRAKRNDYDERGFQGNWGKQQFNEKKTDNSNFCPKKNFEKSKITEVRKLTCYTCGSDKHFRRDCPKIKEEDYKKIKVNKVSAEGAEAESKGETVAARVDVLGRVIPRHTIEDKLCKLAKVSVSVAGKLAEALVDSDTEITVVKRDLVPEVSVEGASTIYLKGIFGPAVKCPLVYVPLSLATGGQVNVVHQQVLCALADVLVEDVLLPPDILNMLGGARSEGNSLAQNSQELRGDLQEKAQDSIIFEKTQSEITSCGNEVGTVNNKDEKVTTETVKGSMVADTFRSEQEQCVELATAWKHAKEGKSNYYEVDGYLFHRDKILGESIGQLVIPKCRRGEVLRLAHTSVFSCHMGSKKTLERIKYSFFWERMRTEVKKFCDSCKECQLTQTVKTSDRTPITPVVRPELPFQVVNVDLIGPIDPPSAKGHKYILCLVDQHTRWGEAIPLTSLNAKATCEALLSIFSRTGIPNVIASDNGTNFTAELTKEFEKRIGSSPRFSTPGYPQSNGLVERFNRTLKNMLHNVVREEGRGWHLQIPYVLWAYREIPHSTTGVSPFQLLYGRPPQGLLSILKSTWTGKFNNVQLNSTSISKYLENLKSKLEKAAEQAKLVSAVQQENAAYYHNLRSSNRVYKVGDQVIVLIPDSTNKLFARWQGTATIVEKRNPHSFSVKMSDGSTKHIHQNKLKHYIASSNSINVIFEEEKEFGHVETLPTATKESKFFEILDNLEIKHVDNSQLETLKNLIVKFKRIFTKPVQPAAVGTHKIELLPNTVQKKPHCYSVPIAYRKEVERQVQELLELDLIEPSVSEIAHPIVCVAKKDSSMRMCIDFRALNAVTKVPVFPMKDLQELIFTAGSGHWLSSLDLLKGYWQIKMDEESKRLTAFATHNAVYQWKTMPFGLAGASGTFQREMNRALKSHSEYAQAYMDDVVIYSRSFKEHLFHLKLILTELDELGFSVRLDKCTFATKQIKYLGHIIGGGRHGPDKDKILAIQKLTRPTSKKEVRSVLGLMGFYRTYIPKFAEISTPLTELTKKNKPNKASWGEEEQNSFEKLKELLCEVTSLATPDANLPFQIHCDASDHGVGCCLTQQDADGSYKPIAFASQKFNAAQKNWASIEKEAWAVLYGLNKFDKWIYGAKVEIISDHNPLKYLNQTTPKSPKLTRWALALQRWNHSITHRPSVQHRGADALSRLK
ncbi:uncharacterized protein LOC129975294 [Argiope bruennichi]|uniref:uncharacterized protein LOC129975294 n=1 Tax=Argiope bruennichi TaxID=94029 RepID=UPI002494836B|nr:uncharacterized protein LOC129975294 [Argiope bruennichi]